MKAVAALRVLTGLLSHDAHTRVSGWLRSSAVTWAYALAHVHGHAPRHPDHNPLGSWMMALLLADVLACGFTGWLYTTDRFWGVAWLETLHGVLGDAFVPQVLLHLAGALWASRLQRENLVAAVLHGHKRPPGPGDVT
jgi:cytochrome b